MVKTSSLQHKGQPFPLRGINLGCWINIENFMIGLEGVDWQNRKALERQIGPEQANLFFNTFHDVYITERDIAYIASLGLNAVRLPFNYRYFESDLDPFVYREKTFRHIDQLMDWCQTHGIVVLLDFHAAPGGQNTTHPADNCTGYPHLWNSRHDQERVIALWKEMAVRYGSHPALLGYDLLNEPQIDQHGQQTLEEQRDQMNSLFGRIIEAIRSVDSSSTIVIEGPVRSSGGIHHLDQRLFEDPNTAASYHYYPFANHESSINYEPNRSDSDQINELMNFIRKQTDTEHEYALEVNRPVILGEFGISRRRNMEQILKIVEAQMRLCTERGHHWMLWSYKDINQMGLVCPRPDTAWRSFVENPEWQELKKGCMQAFRKHFNSIYIERLQKNERNRKIYDAAYNDMIHGLKRLLLDNQIERLKATGLDIPKLSEAFAFDNCEPHPEYEELIRQRL